MKKVGVIMLILGTMLGLFGCGVKVEYPLNEYNLDAYTLPYWEGRLVYQESVMALEDKDGGIPDIPLLYKAKKIVSVRSSDLQTEYKEGKDYKLVEGKLHIPEGSAIPSVKHSFYYPAEETENSMKLNKNYGEGYIFFKEGDTMHSMQLAVTYTHSDSFDSTIPAYKGDQLPKTQAKLKNGEALRLCVYGDSISTGRNSSGIVSALPLAKAWYQMFEDKLEQKYPDTAVSLYNPSVPGKTSEWGVENMQTAVGYGPDLCVIGFGMNDGSAKMPADTYLANIKAIMDTARAANPNCEFVLIATMMPNPETSNFLGNQEAYLPALLSLEAEGVVVADMTTFHKSLLEHKRYFDMSGNNVNHPNDFLARGYAQVLWQTVVGY